MSDNMCMATYIVQLIMYETQSNLKYTQMLITWQSNYAIIIEIIIIHNFYVQYILATFLKNAWVGRKKSIKIP